MSNRIFCLALGALLLALSFPAEAQQQAKIPKIGYLIAGSDSPGSQGGAGQAVRRELERLGYIEGKNIVFESRYADNKLDRLPSLADELVRLKVDVLVTSTTNAAVAAKNATRTIPIVFLSVSDPVAVGLVDSLARPGGNITGVTNVSAVLAGKRLELLKETVPKLSRVAVLWDPEAPGSKQQWAESQLAGRELGLELYSMEVSKADKYDGAFKEALKGRSTALAVTLNPLAISNRKQIAALAVKNRLPAIYPSGDFVDSGGLMSYGVDRTEPYRRAAYYIDKILKGANPADLPVEQPTKYELIINLKTATAIGLTIPSVVMMRAERVVK
jgi:putative tryptophan/tyrosine transport system substrate-binding protein